MEIETSEGYIWFVCFKSEAAKEMQEIVYNSLPPLKIEGIYLEGS